MLIKEGAPGWFARRVPAPGWCLLSSGCLASQWRGPPGRPACRGMGPGHRQAMGGLVLGGCGEGPGILGELGLGVLGWDGGTGLS